MRVEEVQSCPRRRWSLCDEPTDAVGTIPSRSDVLRMALAQYLKVDLSKIEQDRRRTAKD